jgi:hypothetical protein
MPEVVYELSLRDRMSAPLEAISHQAEKLHNHFRGLGNILEGFGVSFLAFKGMEFVKDSVQEVHTLNIAMGQVRQGLISTGEAAGVTFNELNEQAEGFAHKMQFTKGQIMDMQSQLVTFPKIAGESFKDASQLILDMSTRTHHGLNEVAIMVGKALQDPEKGITAMRRVGVNFNEAQTEAIQKMVEAGHVMEAQQAIFKELASEFGGSAEAAFNSDPLSRYNKTMEELKEVVGTAATEMLVELAPALERFANDLKEAVHWVKENWENIKIMTEALGAAYLSFKVFSGVSVFIEAVTIAAGEGATAIGVLGGAFEVALGPIGLMAIAVGGLVILYNKLESSMNAVANAANKFDQKEHDTKYAELEKQAAYYRSDTKKHKAVKDLHPWLNGEHDHVQSAINENIAENKRLQNLLANAPHGDIHNRQHLNSLILENAEQLGKHKSQLKAIDEFEKHESLTPKGAGKVKPPTTDDKEKTKATGSKSVTINVHIKDLIGTQNINTTNLREGAGKIKDLVVEALAGATNDFQVIAAR